MARHHDRLTREARRKRRKPRTNIVARLHQLEVMTYEQNACINRWLRSQIHLERSEDGGEAPDTEENPEIRATKEIFEDFAQAAEEFRAYLTAVRSEME